MEKLVDKICEMANVMQKSVNVDEDASIKDKERLTQLEIENKGLRELLEICSTARFPILESMNEDEKICPTGSNVTSDEKQETEDDEKSGEKTPKNIDLD